MKAVSTKSFQSSQYFNWVCLESGTYLSKGFVNNSYFTLCSLCGKFNIYRDHIVIQCHIISGSLLFDYSMLNQYHTIVYHLIDLFETGDRKYQFQPSQKIELLVCTDKLGLNWAKLSSTRIGLYFNFLQIWFLQILFGRIGLFD